MEFQQYSDGMHLAAAYVKNALGDVVGTYDVMSGVTLYREYCYDAYGNAVEEYDNTNTIPPSENPFRYRGEYYDAETGLYYLRNRYYDPKAGRFITEDPVRDGTNWYTYCAGNPVMFFDPTGLALTVEEAAAMAEHIYQDIPLSDPNDEKGNRELRTVEGWRLIDVRSGRESMKMGIYIREGDDWQNPSEYVVVFRGTSAWFDDGGLSSEARNNIEAVATKKSADMWDAMEYSKEFMNGRPGKTVTFVGHSKGGGEAITAAVYMDSNAITFNAANFDFHKYVKGFGKGRIDNYYVEGEILESSIGTAIIGNTHWLPTQYAPSFKWYDNAWTRTAKRIKAAVANHSMSAVRDAL